MSLPKNFIEQVDAVAGFRYISAAEKKVLNAHLREGEPPVFCGWEWIAKRSNEHQQGFMTISATRASLWWGPRMKRRLLRRRP